MVWDWKAPERIRFFLWLATHRRLLTNAERYKRHLTQDSHCEFYSEVEEDILHVLRHCPVAYYVWVCLVPRDMVNIFFSLDFDDWLFFNLKSKTQFSVDITWSMIFGVSCGFCGREETGRSLMKIL